MGEYTQHTLSLGGFLLRGFGVIRVRRGLSDQSGGCPWL